jgi:proteasome lid subunit RPN8/RPN11
MQGSHLAAIIQQAGESQGREVCGLLGGRFTSDGLAVHAEQIHAVPNISPTPDNRFAMHSERMVEVIMAYRRAGLEVVGVYHSHPASAPIPSQTDIDEAMWPDVAYLIIGFVGCTTPRQPTPGLWRIRHGRAEPGRLVVETQPIVQIT